jgi:hypothetical protein
MSSNPYMDYQDQFFKMWNDNMDKMLNSDAYKAMAKNIPGSEAYTKAMEAMIPSVENYWKTMAAGFTGEGSGKKDASADPMDAWKNMMENWQQNVEKMPGMEYWKEYAEKMPGMEYWKEYAGRMPSYQEYWKFYEKMFPAGMNMFPYMNMFPNDMFKYMNGYWDSFSKMMPNMSQFDFTAPFKIPGMESYTKIYDMWKSLGDPDGMVKDFQEKYFEVIGEVMKGLVPEPLQPMFVKPMEYMDTMVDYYKEYVAPWMEIDSSIMERLAQGDIKAYADFFRDYQEKYEQYVEKYFNIMGMGMNREANEDYMRAMNNWNKALISMGELMAVIMETAVDSFQQIGDKVNEDLAAGKTITTFRDFYDIWYPTTEAAFESLLSTDEFAKVFDDFADRYGQYMIAQNKVYERMLAFLPIPTNTDMKSLYKTVYDLRKAVRDLTKQMAGKEDKKEAK